MFRRTPRPEYYSQKYYESSYGDLDLVSENEKRALILLHAQTNDISLDIGCGRGTFLKEVASRCQWSVGVDYSKKAIQITKLNIKGVENADVVRASVTRLPFRAEVFVKASMLEVLEHLDKKDSVLATDEIYRILKSGCKVIISTPYVEFPISLCSKVYRIMTRSLYSSLHVDEKSVGRTRRLMHKFSNKFILLRLKREPATNWRDKLLRMLKYPHPKLSGQLFVIGYKARKKL